MKQFLVLLTTSIYFSCFGAASSQAGDVALAMSTQSLENDPSVVAAVAPLIRLLPGKQTIKHQFAYTSLGTQQLFGCLLAGKHTKMAKRLIKSIRTMFDVRLINSDYAAFKDRHRHYPLCERDIIRGIHPGRLFTDIIQRKTFIMIFAASAHGVQTFCFKYRKSRSFDSFVSKTTGVPAHAEPNHGTTHVSGTQTYVVDKRFNIYLLGVETECKSALFDVYFNTEQIMDYFDQALPEDESFDEALSEDEFYDYE
jgi:hypothetical protein